MRFVFACGGTAGHINPALGVAGRIRELLPSSEILFIGAEGKMEMDLVPPEGYEIRGVPVSNLSRSISPEGIAHNIVHFLLQEKAAGRLSADRVPLQSGVGAVANAVLLGLRNSERLADGGLIVFADG